MQNPSSSPNKQRAALDGFLTQLDVEMESVDDNNRVAALIMSLHRSDRLVALLNSEYAETSRLAFIELLNPVLRDKDQFVFVGEDECWFFLPHLSSDALAILAAHRILTALSVPLKIASHTIFFNPNIGIACAPTHTQNSANLLRAAEMALKNAQANNLDFYIAEHHFNISATPADLPKALEEVLDANTLELRYQPKIDLRTRRVASVEALVRWPTEHAQTVETSLLIDVAERCGMIELLTMRVFNGVLQDMVVWRQSGVTILVWVNLSAKLLSLEHLPAILSRQLSIWNVPATSIGLEITESAFINDIEHTTNVLFELRELGFHLSIDDFGTGYSSLAYLRRFPIDELKIDRMFVHGMTESIQDRQIVQSIIGLAHNFGLQVVAEGVEEPATLAELEMLGCDQIQGFLFARPMPGNELIAWCNDFHHE
jgi:EAL domain-containing protein (putative c-di-GMP-specific phosphodiesterase class I)